MTALTHRFAQAVDYARIAHASQERKGSGIPYIYHVLGVATLSWAITATRTKRLRVFCTMYSRTVAKATRPVYVLSLAIWWPT